MAARKKSTAKKSVRGTAKKAASRLDRLTQDLPPTLRDFQARVQKQLNALEKEIERRQTATRKQAAHLLRQASHQLGRLEAEGESAWARLTEGARKELLRLLHRLEAAIAPNGAKKRAKAGARKVTHAAKRATASVSSAASNAASSLGGMSGS
jgi:ABC-type transporter Mla subunit MlaD